MHYLSRRLGYQDLQGYDIVEETGHYVAVANMQNCQKRNKQIKVHIFDRATNVEMNQKYKLK
uniref:Uncharacterized protein n=1 Tax=Romanomermis culicivorax TaxID=13658 RepID=A0A915IL47_ROMCU